MKNCFLFVLIISSLMGCASEPLAPPTVSEARYVSPEDVGLEKYEFTADVPEGSVGVFRQTITEDGIVVIDHVTISMNAREAMFSVLIKRGFDRHTNASFQELRAEGAGIDVHGKTGRIIEQKRDGSLEIYYNGEAKDGKMPRTTAKYKLTVRTEADFFLHFPQLKAYLDFDETRAFAPHKIPRNLLNPSQ